MRGNHTLMFLSLSFSLPLSKNNFFLNLKNKTGKILFFNDTCKLQMVFSCACCSNNPQIPTNKNPNIQPNEIPPLAVRLNLVS